MSTAPKVVTPLQPSPLKPAQTRTVVVQAANGWQTSGIDVKGKEFIQINASGLWTANPSTGMVSADGNHNYSTSGRSGYAYSGPSGFEGQLIGRIGTGAPFVVGTVYQRHFLNDEEGILSFVINDDLYDNYGQGLQDNQGQLVVTIVVTEE